MIEILKLILPYIQGLWTLPWILIGFGVTLVLSQFINKHKIDNTMKTIGLILLYCFVPVLLFKIFLNQDFGAQELEFAAVSGVIIFFMYLIAYGFSWFKAETRGLTGASRKRFIKTVVTNQGRSAAFIGGALLTSPWSVEAAIFIALVGVALFAIIPYILSYMHKKEAHRSDESIHALPWYLHLYPWYLILFVIAAVVLHGTTGIRVDHLGDPGVVLDFYAALTIPAALYYVGAGIHPRDFDISEMKKLFSRTPVTEDITDHWPWVRTIFFLTAVVTPVVISLVFIPLFILKVIPPSWFAVVVINAILPITSTNMFLIPYGIDKKTTAHAVTWTTLVCVPVVVVLIYVFTIFFP